MLEVQWPVHAIGFAPFALAVTLVALPPEPERPSELRIGTVMRDTLRATDDGYTFTLFDPMQGGCVARIYEVTFDGPLPDTICDGASVAVYGEIDDAHERLAATSVIGFNHGRYDPCWEARCLPEARRPERCQRSLRYE